MRKILIMMLALSPLVSVAQQNTKKAYDYLMSKNIASAKEAIDLAGTSDEEKNNPDTWFIRGEVYYAIATSDNPSVNALHPSPGQEALKAYLKTENIDTDKKHLTNIIIRLKSLSVMFFNTGVKSFNNNSYKAALQAFENSIQINNLPIVLKVDTVLFFNTAKAAEKAKEYDKAIKYYIKLTELNYGGSKIYQGMANVYEQKGDAQNYLRTLSEGIRNFPDDNIILLKMLINYHLTHQNFDEAKKYLEQVLEKEPDYAPFHYVLGTIYERNDNTDEAEKCYKRTVEIEPDHFEANYNIAVIYYNKAAQQIKIANAKTVRSEYEEEKKKVDELFMISLAYYEICYKVKPDDQETLKSLDFLYGRFEMTDKQNEVRAKIK